MKHMYVNLCLDFTSPTCRLVSCGSLPGSSKRTEHDVMCLNPTSEAPAERDVMYKTPWSMAGQLLSRPPWKAQISCTRSTPRSTRIRASSSSSKRRLAVRRRSKVKFKFQTSPCRGAASAQSLRMGWTSSSRWARHLFRQCSLRGFLCHIVATRQQNVGVIWTSRYVCVLVRTETGTLPGTGHEK